MFDAALAPALKMTPEPRARVPLRTVLASIAGLWLCYFVLSTLRAELIDLGFAWEMMAHRALASLAGMIITIGLWLVLRMFDDKPLWAKIAAALVLSLPVAMSIAQANYLVFLDMRESVAARMAQRDVSTAGAVTDRNLGADPRLGSEDIMLDPPGLSGLPVIGSDAGLGTPEPDWAIARQQEWLLLTELTFSRYYLMLAWCALYLALLTGEKARAAERREGAFRRAAKAAELQSLRYQVNPHFLFNTLNSLSALVLTGRTADAEQMIQTLSNFYRRSLAEDLTADVPLASEFALQRLYLEIEAVRFPSRLAARYELPAALEQVRVPGMILQPLVENAVKHAVAPSLEPVTITLTAREEYGRLVVSVSDDGGIRAEHTEPRTARPGHGIGLANVRQRLAARFGNEASMVSGLSASGYVTHLRLPITVGAERGE